MSSDETRTPKRSEAPPITLDFGGPIGRADGHQSGRRPQSDPPPNLPEPPGDWSKQKPPGYPSLF